MHHLGTLNSPDDQNIPKVLCNELKSAVCLMQLTYSLTRFGIYETVRDRMGSETGRPLPFYQKVLVAAFGGMLDQTVTYITRKQTIL